MKASKIRKTRSIGGNARSDGANPQPNMKAGRAAIQYIIAKGYFRAKTERPGRRVTAIQYLRSINP